MTGEVNVVFMGNFVYPRGMADAKRIQYFIDYLSAQSVQARVLLLRQGGVSIAPEAAQGSHQGVPYRTIGYDMRADASLICKLPGYLRDGIGALRSWRARQKKNILYSYGALSLENVAFVLAARMLGYRVILDIVEDNTYIKEKQHLLARLKWLSGEILERYIARCADALVVISRYLDRLYKDELDGAIPIRLIPICASCRERLPKAPRPERVTFVYSGSFAKKDGLELLIEAFQRVHRKRGNCELLLTGMGANLEQYRALIQGSPCIRYVGYLEDAEFVRFLQQADVLCITRTGTTYANAGFPFKLGEYLATGNPVIVSNVGDVSYYLENMTDAIMVEPDSVAAIEQALEYCLSNPEQAARIGLSGQAKCRQYFDPGVNGRKLLELMQSL